MSRRMLVRVLPGPAWLALLCISAAGPRTPLTPWPPSLFTHCPQPTEVGGGTGTQTIVNGAGVSQLLPAGVYFVHARDTDGAHAVKRVVVVR